MARYLLATGRFRTFFSKVAEPKAPSRPTWALLKVLRERGYRVRNPELTVATADHGISTTPGRADDTNPPAASNRATTFAVALRML